MTNADWSLLQNSYSRAVPRSHLRYGCWISGSSLFDPHPVAGPTNNVSKIGASREGLDGQMKLSEKSTSLSDCREIRICIPRPAKL